MDARAWLMRVAAVFVIGLLAFFAIGYLGHSSKIRVMVDNTSDSSISAFAQLNATDGVVRSSGDFTIPPHSTHVITWSVHPGSFEVYVNWADTYGTGGIELPGIGKSAFYYDWEDFYIGPFSSKNVIIEPILGSW